MENVSLSVVIPAYNEAKRIIPTVNAVHGFLKTRFEEFEIIVVDDGSTDETTRIVSELKLDGVRLLKNPANMGKGASVRKGVLDSTCRFILMSDADMSTPIEEVDKLLGYIGQGYDIAIGSRALKDSDIEIKQPWYRQNMGKIFNLFVRILLMGDYKDTQCGFKLFKSDVAKRLFGLSKINGFSFDAEVVFLALKLGYKIKESPVRWLNSPESRVRLLRDPMRMLVELVRIRSNWAKGLYRE